MNFKDYYEVLEVHRNASREVIDKAYITLAKKYHPDLNKNNIEFANEKMKELNEAYDILSDEIKRREYNEKYDSMRRSNYAEYNNYSRNNTYSNGSNGFNDNLKTEKSKASNSDNSVEQNAKKVKQLKNYLIAVLLFDILLIFTGFHTSNIVIGFLFFIFDICGAIICAIAYRKITGNNILCIILGVICLFTIVNIIITGFILVKANKYLKTVSEEDNIRNIPNKSSKIPKQIYVQIFLFVFGIVVFILINNTATNGKQAKIDSLKKDIVQLENVIQNIKNEINNIELKNKSDQGKWASELDADTIKSDTSEINSLTNALNEKKQELNNLTAK